MQLAHFVFLMLKSSSLALCSLFLFPLCHLFAKILTSMRAQIADLSTDLDDPSRRCVQAFLPNFSVLKPG